jgi:hypothetical protein
MATVNDNATAAPVISCLWGGPGDAAAGGSQLTRAAIGVDSCRVRGYATGGWFGERGAYLTLGTQVWIALPRSSSFLRGRNVGHFHTRP